jgi:23S rRNA pseudouridine1911/1915/1917 synthase
VSESAVSTAEAGQTLGAVVRARLGLPWTRAKELCTSGRVFVDGARVLDAAYRVRAGEVVRAEPEGRKMRKGALEPDDIVHADADVVVVKKAAGILTVPYEPTDRDTLVDRTQAALRRRDRQRGQGAPLGVVQRLDKETTGLVVFARTFAAKRHLQQQFRIHSIERRYVAIVHGSVRRDRFSCESVLVQDRGDGLRGSYGVFRKPSGPPPHDAREAVTHVEVLERLSRATLIACRLETGRQHQIRIHLSEAGHVLLGERVYVREMIGEPIAAPRPMLHAIDLGFVHPRTGRKIRFTEPMPADFEAMLASLR